MQGELDQGTEMRVIAPGTAQVSLPWHKHFHGQVRRFVPIFIGVMPSYSVGGADTRPFPPLSLIPCCARTLTQDLPSNKDADARELYLSTIRHRPCASAPPRGPPK